MFNILTYDNIPQEGLNWLSREKYLVGTKCAHPDAILLRSFDLHGVPIAESVLAIGRSGSGVNNIPVDACSKRGIPVFNAPGANANAVKELTIAGMLIASRNLTAAWQFIRELDGDDICLQKTVEKEKKRFSGVELAGKTLAIVGLGAIGVQVANSAVALGMRVVAYDPSLTVKRALQLSSSVISASSIEELLPAADFVTLHVPLNEHTRHLIDVRRLSRMKEGAVIINFSRAGVVDEASLCDALATGKVRAYVSDFPTRALLVQPRAIVLPHLGASTAEAEIHCARMAAESLVDFLENGEIRNSVNLPEAILPRNGGPRLTIANENKPGVVNSISGALASAGLNIEDMLNKSRDQYAYTIVDLDAEPSADTLRHIGSTDGVLSVRLLAAVESIEEGGAKANSPTPRDHSLSSRPLETALT